MSDQRTQLETNAELQRSNGASLRSVKKPTGLLLVSLILSAMFTVSWLVTLGESMWRGELPEWGYWGVFGSGFGMSLGWLAREYVLGSSRPARMAMASSAYCFGFTFAFFAGGMLWGLGDPIFKYGMILLYLIGLMWVIWFLELMWRQYKRITQTEHFTDLSADLAKLFKLALICFPAVPFWARKRPLPIRITSLIVCGVGYALLLWFVIVPGYLMASMHFNLQSVDNEVAHLDPNSNVVLVLRPANAWQSSAFDKVRDNWDLQSAFFDWMDTYGLSSVGKFSDIKSVVIGIPGDEPDPANALMVLRFRNNLEPPENLEVFVGPARDEEADERLDDITGALQSVKKQAEEDEDDSKQPKEPGAILPDDPTLDSPKPDGEPKTDSTDTKTPEVNDPKSDDAKTEIGASDGKTDSTDTKTAKTAESKSESKAESKSSEVEPSKDEPDGKEEKKFRFELVNYGGQTYYRPSDETRKSVFYMPRPDTLITGSEEAVRKAIDRDGSTQLDWLSEINTHHHVVFAVANKVAESSAARSIEVERQRRINEAQGKIAAEKSQEENADGAGDGADDGDVKPAAGDRKAEDNDDKQPADGEAPVEEEELPEEVQAAANQPPSPIFENVSTIARGYRFGSDSIRQSMMRSYKTIDHATEVESLERNRVDVTQEQIKTNLQAIVAAAKEIDSKYPHTADEVIADMEKRMGLAVTRSGSTVESRESLGLRLVGGAVSDIGKVVGSMPDNQIFGRVLFESFAPIVDNAEELPGESSWKLSEDGWSLYSNVLGEDVTNSWVTFGIVAIAGVFVLATWGAWVFGRWLEFRRTLAPQSVDKTWWVGPETGDRYTWNPFNPDAWYYGIDAKKLNQTFGAFLAYSIAFYLMYFIITNIKGCELSVDSPAGGGEAAIQQVVQVQKVQKIKYIINPFSMFEVKIPDIDDVKVVDEEMTHHAYTVGYGKGKGAGFAGGKKGGKVRFIRLEYSGGGSTWAEGTEQGADLNMLFQYFERTSQPVHERLETKRVGDLARYTRLGAPPFVFLTGSGGISLSNREVKSLREYLVDKHGMVFCDNGGSTRFEGAFRAIMRRAVPEAVEVAIPADSTINRQPYKIPHPIPLVSLHGSSRLAKGWRLDGRWIAYYHPGDINDAWKDSYTDKTVKEICFRLGTNIIFYAYAEHAKWKVAQEKK